MEPSLLSDGERLSIRGLHGNVESGTASGAKGSGRIRDSLDELCLLDDGALQEGVVDCNSLNKGERWKK